MRPISDAALAKILQREGTDPIILVQIFWTETTSVIYGDRAFAPGIEGRLLDVSQIEDVLDATKGTKSGSISIRLDDSDGQIKKIMDGGVDIHKRPVYVLQWFPDINLQDAFILYDGVINTPITWKEGERTLSFEVLDKIESLEVGYSAEEGNFEYIPKNIVGKAWPLIFGQVLHVPALQINEIPSGFSANDTGIHAAGHAKSPLKEFANNEQKNIENLEELERECFLMAAILLTEADVIDSQSVHSNIDGLSGGGTIVNQGGATEGDFTTPGIALSGEFIRKSDNPLAQQLYDLGSQYEQKGNEYRKERLTFNPNNSLYKLNKDQGLAEKNQIRIPEGAKFPQQQAIIININGANHEGYFEGDIFTIIDRTHPFTDQGVVTSPTQVIERAVATEFKTNIAAQKFFYAIAGSLVGLGPTDYPVYYIVGIPWVSNIIVLAKKRDGTATKYVVPSSYYTIQYATFDTLQATLVVMYRPLSSRTGEKWEDDIWVDCNSPLGPNPADILSWIITNYTNETPDATSFATAHAQLAPYKMGFALLNRKNAIEVLKDIAYQARCAIWFRGGRYFLKYLPSAATPVETFTENDIESGTMEISATDTEDLVTKWTITWQDRLDRSPKDQIVYRYHVKKYGIVEQTYDAYCWNNQGLVEKFALFWLLRKANTWKLLKFSTFLTKLRVEAFDSVLINFSENWVKDVVNCTTPVIGIVQKALYNSDTSRIDMEVWLPIRFGEMCPYPYAYPSDLDITYFFPLDTDPGIQNDIPGAHATGKLLDQSKHRGNAPKLSTPKNFGNGGGASVGDSKDSGDATLNPPVELSPADLVNTVPDAVVNDPDGQVVSQRLIKPFTPSLGDLGNAVYPGFVKTQADSANLYDVDVYFQGMRKPPKTITVQQLLIDNNDVIPPGTPTMVTQNVFRADNGLISSVEYTMQVPVWLKPNDTSTGSPDPTPPQDEGSAPTLQPAPTPETDGGDE